MIRLRYLWIGGFMLLATCSRTSVTSDVPVSVAQTAAQLGNDNGAPAEVAAPAVQVPYPAEPPPKRATAGRQVLVMDQSASMRGFANASGLRQVEDAIGSVFRDVGAQRPGAAQWEFFGVGADVKKVTPPLSNMKSMTGAETNLDKAFLVLTAPDVALGVLVTDGLPSTVEARKRACYVLEMPSVAPLARQIAGVAASGHAMWLIALRIPFSGDVYLNCASVASHQLQALKEAYAGRVPACTKRRDECNCSGECKVWFRGSRPILVFVVASAEWVGQAREAVRQFEQRVKTLLPESTTAAIELFPGTPPGWRMRGPVARRVDLNAPGSPRVTPFRESLPGSNDWSGRDICLTGEEDEVVVELCASRTGDETIVDFLALSDPVVRFADPAKVEKSGVVTNTLSPDFDFLFWDRGWILPPERGVLDSKAYGTCKRLLDRVQSKTDWHKAIADGGGGDWCRQVILLCGCLRQEGKIGTDRLARVAGDVVYSVEHRTGWVPEAIASLSAESEPFLHPEQVFGLATFIKEVEQAVAEVAHEMPVRIGRFDFVLEAR